MYSILLLAAMTAPAEQPSFGRLFGGGGRGGCGGCAGYTAGGCAGSTRGGCVGYSAGGCGGYGGIAAYPHAAGGNWAGGCGGCGGKHGGGCWSTGGYKTHSTCHGAGSCYGHAHAGIHYGFAGCYGSCYGSHTNYFSYWQQPIQVNYGYGFPAPVGGRPIMPPVNPPGVEPGRFPVKPVEPPAKPPVKPDGGAPFAASVVVSLPADAILYANGVRTSQTDSERYFVTPELEVGRQFNYIFTAEIVRNDALMTETVEVTVEAGGETRVTFSKLIAAASGEPARVASK